MQQRRQFQMSHQLLPPSWILPHKGAEDEGPPSRQLWIGSVGPDVTEALLMENFAGFGIVDKVTVYSSRNYAFVQFKNLEDAIVAKASMQGKIVGSNPLRIQFAKPAKQSRNLWVTGLSHRLTKEELEKEFKKFGALQELKLVKDHHYAIVEYEKLESAVNAVKMLNGTCIGNEEVRVDFLRSQPGRKDNDSGLNPIQADMKSASSSLGVETSTLRSTHFIRGKHQTGDSTDAMTGRVTGARVHSGERPSKVLWIGYPGSIRVDDEILRRAFILFGEVERVRMVPGRNFCFVQFRNAEEARLAKDGMQGRLFNDPRVQIRFSYSDSDLGQTVKDDGVCAPSHHEGILFHEPVNPRLSPLDTEMPDIKRLVADSNSGGPNFISRSETPRLVKELRLGQVSRLSDVHATGSTLPVSHLQSLPDGRGVLGPQPDGPGPNYRQAAGGPSYNDLSSKFEFTPRHASSPLVAVEEGIPSRELKRHKASFSSSSDRLHEVQLFGPHVEQQTGDRNSFEDFKPGFPNETKTKGQGRGTSVHSPFYEDVSEFRIPSQESDLAGVVEVQNNLENRWRWQGVVAKGGAPVFHAVGFLMGRGFDVLLPSVLNCSARTGLDMLAKHFYKAADFGLISFHPDGEQECSCYQEFQHYLGDKHRAGVAKLEDGSTLFLIPPSDFSLNVLNIRDDGLFGVVLKSTQMVQRPIHQRALLPEEESQQHGFQLKPSRDGPDWFQDASAEKSRARHTLEPAQDPGVSLDQSSMLNPDFIASLSLLLPLHNQYFNHSASEGSTGFEVGGSLACDLRQELRQSLPVFEHSQTNTGQGFCYDQTTLEHATGLVPDLLGEGSANQHQACILQTIPSDNGGIPMVTQTEATAGYVPNSSATVSVRPEMQYPSAAKSFSHLMPFLTEQQQSGQACMEELTHAPQHQEALSQLTTCQLTLPVTTEGGSSSTIMHSTGQLQNQGSTLTEIEKHNQFQATLQLAAALLQSIHN